jgi:hypothetical protein
MQSPSSPVPPLRASCLTSLRIIPPAAAPSAAPPPRSVAVGFGGYRGAGIGTAHQGLEPGLELGEPLVLAPWPPADCVYSCSVSFSICSLSLLIRAISISIALIRLSSSGSRRQLSVVRRMRAV